MSIQLKYDFGGAYPGCVQDDLTLYYRRGSTGDEAADFHELTRHFRFESSIDLEVEIPSGRPCRGLACWCQSRQCIALTLRDHGVNSGVQPGRLPQMLAGYDVAPRKLRQYIEASRKELTRLTSQVGQEEPAGLIAIAGQTKSGKSVLADGLLRALIPASGGHVIALGKPVDWLPYHDPGRHTASETGGQSDCRDLSKMYGTYGIYYTPRTLDVDTTLEQALLDALRQKPAAVYLDEVRRELDWGPILRFAESGHLIVTTTHSGSVRDALAWIFRAMQVERRSQAPGVARRILAIIHAKLEPDGSDQPQHPELWLGSRGAGLIGAYGLGALIPSYDENAAYVAREFIRAQA